jgi:hypothetical protein
LAKFDIGFMLPCLPPSAAAPLSPSMKITSVFSRRPMRSSSSSSRPNCASWYASIAA